MAGPAAEWLAVGLVRKPHGVHGEALVDIVTDFPERLTAGIEVGLGGPPPERFLRVERVRLHKGAWLLLFAGLDQRDDVDAMRQSWLYLPARPRSELPPNYYYEHELVGLRCVLGDGRPVGEVTALTDGGGSMLLSVCTARGEALVPFRSPLVLRVDLAAGELVLDPPRGLLDGDAL